MNFQGYDEEDGDAFNALELPQRQNREQVQGAGLRVQGSGFRVQGSGFRVQGSGYRVRGAGLRFEG